MIQSVESDFNTEGRDVKILYLCAIVFNLLQICACLFFITQFNG